MNPTALTLNPETGAICLPIGATGSFIARIILDEGATIDESKDVMLFSVSAPDKINSDRHKAALVLKELQIQRADDETLFVQVDLKNADTRDLFPGSYVWDLTLVTNPVRDDQGELVVRVDDGSVVPVFSSKGKYPKFRLNEVGYIV